MSVARAAGERLAALRALMRAARLAAYIVPSSDAHSSEYVAERDMRRRWLSGFTGSAGTAVVTLADARTWTDGRYFLQAERELDASAGWQLMKDRLPETPTIEAWLGSVLARGDAVGLDPYVMSYGAVKRMAGVLAKAGVALTPTPDGGNLVDAVWGAEQPAAPCARIVTHPVSRAGASVADKLGRLREALRKEACAALVVTALDEVAWLFNIRGGDVECNPVAIAYGVVTLDSATLCVDAGKLDDHVRAHLAESGVGVAPYADAAALAAAVAGRVWLDPASCNYAVYSAVLAGGAAEPAIAAAAAAAAAAGGSAPAPAAGAGADTGARVLERMSPLQLLKAIKNPVELQGACVCARVRASCGRRCQASRVRRVCPPQALAPASPPPRPLPPPPRRHARRAPARRRRAHHVPVVARGGRQAAGGPAPRPRRAAGAGADRGVRRGGARRHAPGRRRVRGPVLPHHRRLRRQRCDHPLPRRARHGGARRRRRHVLAGLGRPVP